MSARPKAKSARASKHRIPIGLQIAIRAMDPGAVEGEYLRDNLKIADEHAAHLLNDPLIRLDEDGPALALGALANHFGAETLENKIANAIPDSVTHDPHALVTDLAVCWKDAGLYLGLCLGFRIASALSGKE